MEILMKCRAKVINKLKPTKAMMFKNVEIGDILEFSVPIEYVGGNNGRTYAVNIKVENLRNQEITWGTFNQLPKILTLFEFEEELHGK